MRESLKVSVVTNTGSCLSRGGVFVLALLLAACATPPPYQPTTRPVQPPASPMATVAKLTAVIGERGPSDDVLKRGESFLRVWRDYVEKTQDASIVHGWRDHIQVSMPDGSTMSCRYRDTPNLQATETGGFAKPYHLSLKMNCGNGQSYERYWNVFPSMNGAEVMLTLRPVSAQIANFWNQLTLVPAEAPGAFEAQAQAYRAAATKPELSELAREFKVRAESAVAERRFLDAVEAYDRALQIAPWWPQGHFNAALVLGELKTYGLAVEEMQRYLALVPDATNARQAQDKIYAWRGKLEKAF